MKPGLVASTALHAAALTWGLWSFSSPELLDVSYAEALPVEIVMAEVFEGVAGEKQAPITDMPAPTPTTRPETLPMPAENAGDNEADLATPPVIDVKPNKVEPTPAPKAASAPEPEPVPDEAAPEEPEIAETPPPEPAPEPEPVAPAAAPTEPDPVEEAITRAAAEPEPQEQPVPQNVPVPRQKPRPPEPQIAQAQPPKPKAEAAKPKQTEVAEETPAKESEFNTDEIAALLNTEKASGGGAKRSTEVASLGSKKTTGAKLSSSQLGQIEGLLNEQMARCYSVPTGALDAEDLKVSIRIAFDPSGGLVGAPEIVRGGGSSGLARIASEAAVRAIKRCAPFNLPAELYDGGWEDTTLNFDPSTMF